MLKKIADECGVALSTVSTALNHPEKISTKTRDHIFEVATQLGYFKKKYRIQCIGVCTYGLNHMMWSEFYIHILEGILLQAEIQGIKLKFFSFHSEFTYESVQDVSGMLFLGKTPTSIIHRIQQLKIPFILCADPNIEVQASTIYFDNQKGAFIATDFLLSKGHRNIAILLSHPPTQDFTARERLNGYQSALQKHQVPFSENNIFYGDYENFDLLETVFGTILKQKPKITAIFCESDIFAYKILSLSSKFSVQIPLDISLMGFDGICFPKVFFQTNQILTTIETNMIGLGGEAFKRLIQRIQEGKDTVESIILPVKLCVGDTVAEIKSVVVTAS